MAPPSGIPASDNPASGNPTSGNPTASLLRIERRGVALLVTLDDAATRNAMSPAMLGELAAVVAGLARDPARCLVLRGANGAFCSGGDIASFASDAATTPPMTGDDPVVTANRAFGTLLQQLDAAPQLVVSLVEGPAFGGGCGLVCASDVAIALADARFALSETTLGVAPAQISPFVVRRLGVPRARWLTMTGARFDGRAALTHGLADIVCDTAGEAEAALADILAGVARCAPRANAATKALYAQADSQPIGVTLDGAARTFADALRDEGREGAAAFLARRRPAWAQDAE
ncbi:MAG: enoyl-CoA hydratase/isomerase [Caulobacter sp.]|nr:enoyl-CoA hydratase/isomerase [Caulobacter sp.]